MWEEKTLSWTIRDIVYMVLLRNGHQLIVRRFAEKEIDFMCKRRGEKGCMQDCYLMAPECAAALFFVFNNSLHIIVILCRLLIDNYCCS